MREGFCARDEVSELLQRLPWTQGGEGFRDLRPLQTVATIASEFSPRALFLTAVILPEDHSLCIFRALPRPYVSSLLPPAAKPHRPLRLTKLN